MIDLKRQAEEVHRHWLHAMYEGNFEDAWQATDQLELPRRDGGVLNPEYHLRWNGTALHDQQILIRCLHGLGDTLQFIRYLPLVRKMAASVVTFVQPALLPLLQTTAELGSMEDGWVDTAPSHTLEMEIMELAYAFRSTALTLPHSTPYLDVAAIRAASSLELRLPWDSIQVGLVWSASSWNPSRSIPLSALTPILDLRGFSFHSLQQEAGEEIQGELPLHNLSNHTTQILDAASAMLQLDLIITVDTLTAHLAGALGCPVWLLLKQDADWRWQRTSTRSPWYPTMRIFRQPTPGDWPTVVRSVVDALKEFDPSKRMDPRGENGKLTRGVFHE